MAQDLRNMFKDVKEEGVELSKGHQSRFEDRLAQALPVQEQVNKGSQKGLFFYMKIAAVFILLAGTVWFVAKNAFAKADSDENQIVSTGTDEKQSPEEKRTIQLSDISPDFKKVEDYYLASINLEITRLEINDENKELIDSFLKQLAALDKEYQRLNKEITESGISEEMVNAMIENLKLRVELLSKLKRKLSELKASQEDAIQTI